MRLPFVIRIQERDKLGVCCANTRITRNRRKAGMLKVDVSTIGVLLNDGSRVIFGAIVDYDYFEILVGLRGNAVERPLQ
jgi:hypothetical protein